MEGMVGPTSGVVLAVDERLRILASSPGAQDVLHLPSSDITGKPCYEILSLIDPASGQSCYQNCPLVDKKSDVGWVHSRVLELDEKDVDGPRIDCLALRCVTPDTRQWNLCFLEPYLASGMETQSRILQAIEAIYPATSGNADIKEVLSAALTAVVRTTQADGGEVFLLDHDSHDPVIRVCQGTAPDLMDAFCASVLGNRCRQLAAEPPLPLLATGAWPDSSPTEVSGSYLCAPLVVEGRIVGALAIASRRNDFDIALAAKVVFPVTAQLGVYLRWAYPPQTGEAGQAQIPEPTETGLRIHSLGAFKVVLHGETIPMSRFHRFKAVTLLKFLAAHQGRPVPRETLIELLWPDADPERANGNLRVVLHALRHALEPDLRKGEPSSFVVGEGELIYLRSSDKVWIDTQEFVRLVRAGSRLVSQDRTDLALREYRRAASLYQGEYLEDEPYSDWCLFERERLNEVYIYLMKQIASLLTETCDPTGAIESHRNALCVDRGREEIHRELMTLLWQEGRRDEALRQYDTCRRILTEDLGVEPTQETTDLYNSILSGTPS